MYIGIISYKDASRLSYICKSHDNGQNVKSTKSPCLKKKQAKLHKDNTQEAKSQLHWHYIMQKRPTAPHRLPAVELNDHQAKYCTNQSSSTIDNRAEVKSYVKSTKSPCLKKKQAKLHKDNTQEAKSQLHWHYIMQKRPTAPHRLPAVELNDHQAKYCTNQSSSTIDNRAEVKSYVKSTKSPCLKKKQAKLFLL